MMENVDFPLEEGPESSGGELTPGELSALRELLGRTDEAKEAERRIGPYRLVELIGQGGQGRVYLAEDTRLPRRVALKLLAMPLVSSRESLLRFRREAEAASRLDDPGICSVYEAGEADGVHYIAMRYVDGSTLAEEILATRERFGASPGTRAVHVGSPRTDADAGESAASSEGSSGRESIHRAVLLMERVARSLHVAHEAGLVHRDVKPGNIMITRAGDPVILDFGLARDEESDGQALTMTGDCLGTPAYVSPEQIGQNKRLIDRRTDVYSLGVTLYECVTLERPFVGLTRDALYRRILEGAPPDPSWLNPHVRRDLKVILETALEKDRHRRYQTALEFAEDLRRFRTFQPILAQPAGPGVRFHRWLQRNPVLATATLGLFLLLSTGLGISLILLGRVEEQRQIAEGNLRESLVAQARAGRWSGRAGQRFDSLEVLAQAAGFRPTQELRDEAIACLVLPDLRLTGGWEDYPEGRDVVGQDRSFQIRALGDGRGNVVVERTSDGTELLSIPGGGDPVRSLRISPDRETLAVRSGGDYWRPYDLAVWDLTTSEPLFTVERAHFDAMDFSPDGRRLCSAHIDPSGEISVRIFSLPDGVEQVRLSPVLGARALGFDPSGQRVAIATDGGSQVLLWRPASGSVRSLPHPGSVKAVAWHPGGRLLAAGTKARSHDIFLWDTESLEAPLRILQGHDNAVTWLGFTRRGNTLVSSSWDVTMRTWDPMTGRQTVVVEGPFWDAQIAPDDRSIVIRNLDPRGAVYELAAEDERMWLRGETGPVEAWEVEFSGDDRLVAATCSDGVRLWSVASGHQVAFLPVTAVESSVHFHPDGKSLITSGGGCLLRYPIEWRSEGRTLAILQPAILGVHRQQARSDLAPSAGVMALVRSASSVSIVGLDDARELTRLGPHQNVRYAILSPDGRWCATTPWGLPRSAMIWNARTGELLKTLPMENARALFSPDGDWLALSEAGECRILDTDTWSLRQRIERDPATAVGGALAVTSDGRILALAYSQRGVHLVDARDGARLARLEMPDLRWATDLTFSHDGTRLAATSRDGVVVWDLRQIRRRLGAMGLDWDSPPYPASVEADAVPLEVDLSFDEITFLEDVLLRYPTTNDPEHEVWNGVSRAQAANLSNRLARLYAMRRRPEDLERALALALRSDRLGPGRHPILDILGRFLFGSAISLER